jgi:hypothetical protein
MLHLALFLVATTLMLMSTAAALCALALSARSIITFCFAPLVEACAENGSIQIDHTTEDRSSHGAHVSQLLSELNACHVLP